MLSAERKAQTKNKEQKTNHKSKIINHQS